MNSRSGVWLWCGAVLLVAGVAGSAQTDHPSTPHHFGLVISIHDAVVRGDVEEARKQARALADAPAPPNMPASAAPHLAAVTQAASRLESSSDLAEIASQSASLLGTCGECHRASGKMPAIAASGPPAIGGAVGHMLAHKHAADLLVQGLTTPSTSSWNEGAKALRSAPLRKDQLPRDPKLTDDIVAKESQVHTLADRAGTAADSRARVGVYGELLQSCGSCHALHGNIWGPQRK